MKVTFLYFSWIREILGKHNETIDIPSNIKTVIQLLEWQKNRGSNYEIVFDKRRKEVRIAIDLEYVKNDTYLKKPKEIAFFPPVTGG